MCLCYFWLLHNWWWKDIRVVRKKLKAKQSVCSVEYVEVTTQKPIPTELQDQYKINNNEILCNFLLSPRAHVNDGSYMSCKTCHRLIAYNNSDKPPKFAVSNSWLIGKILKSVISPWYSGYISFFICKS